MNSESLPSTLVINFPHPILSTNVAELRTTLAKQFTDNPNCLGVEVNLEHCPTIDSSGLNRLAAVYRECIKREIPFKVTNPSQDIHRLLTILKLNERFGLPPLPTGT